MKKTFLFIALLSLFAFPAQAKAKKYDCKLTYNLKSWSVFYKKGKGTGVITCNGLGRIPVLIHAHGGGITFGKKKIVGGKGTFSGVDDVSELFGSYAYADAHAGAKKSAEARAMTKGDISLALSGTGEGYDLGFAFGSFKISGVKKR